MLTEFVCSVPWEVVTCKSLRDSVIIVRRTVVLKRIVRIGGGWSRLRAYLMSDFSRRIAVLEFSATEIYFAGNITKGFIKFSVSVPALLFRK